MAKDLIFCQSDEVLPNLFTLSIPDEVLGRLTN